MSRIYAKRCDKNQTQIVKDLRSMGFSVETNHDDILVGKHGKTLWIEIKDSSPFRKDGKLKPNPSNKKGIQNSQYKILWNWKGQYNICWHVGQIITLFEVGLPLYKGSHVHGITPLMFEFNYKDWLTESELNRLRFEGIINDGVEGKLA